MQFWFLIVCLIFTRHPDANTAQAVQETTCQGTTRVASDPERIPIGVHVCTPLDSPSSWSTPLTRSHFPTTAASYIFGNRSYGTQSPGLEVWNLPHHEQEKCRVLPKMWWLLDGVLRRSAPVGLVNGSGAQIPKTTQQQCSPQNQGERCGKRSRQGPQQRHRWESCSVTLFQLVICAYTGSFDTVAMHGLREVPTGTGTSSPAAIQSIDARIGPCTPEGFPRKLSPSSISPRCNGASREFRDAADHKGLACSNVLSWTCPQGTPGGQRGQIQAEEQLDETSAGKYSGMGSTAGYLPEEYGQTPGHGGQSATGGGQCEEDDPATQFTVRGLRIRGAYITGRVAGCQSGQGGEKAETAVAGHHGYLLVDSRSYPQNRSPGDRFGCRWRRERTEASQSWKSQHLSSTQGRCHFYISIGQALPCQQKVSVIKAKSVNFEIAEAYHDVDHHGAACKSRSPILSTEEAAVYLHSVVHEFDYTDPFKAALNAFCLRGELVFEVTAPIHEDIAVPIVISPHVNDLWCDSCAHETVNDPDQYGRSIPEVVANCRTCPQDSDPSPITCSENSRPQPNDKASDSKCSIPRPLTHLFAAASDADEQGKALLESTEDEITLFSFGYNRRFIERRSLQLRRDDLQRWRQLLRDQWMDHEGGHFDVHGIVPPPVLGKSTISVIVQLSEVPEQSALGLIQFIPSHGQPETPFVEAFPRRVTRSIVFSICGKYADAESTAVIKQGFKLWFAGEVQWIRHGVFLRILVDDPIDDDIGLFQTTISTFEQCKSEIPFLTSRLLDERRAHRVEADRGQQQATPHDQEGTTHLPAGTSRLYPWHLWESFFNDQNNHEEGGVQLAVYGLALESVGTRYTILHEPSRRSLIRRVRALYPENDAWDLRIHFVTPQPVDTQRMTHVLAEFLPTDHPGMGNLCPVLFDVRWFRPGGLYRDYRAAVYKPSPSTRPELLDDLFPRCFPDGGLALFNLDTGITLC